MSPGRLDVSKAYCSWGRVTRPRHLVARPRFRDELTGAIANARAEGRSALGFGLGRSYGDSNLNPDNALIDATGLDRLIAFDAETGLVRAESGIALGDLIAFLAPRGRFPPTCPGTRFVTLGGAIANDVHGKNHISAGSFGCSVTRIGLVRSDRGAIELSPTENPDLFRATIGGLGLTGFIEWAEFQTAPIPSTLVDVERIPFASIDDYFALNEASADAYVQTAAWIDCASQGRAFGRGVYTRARWAPEGGFDPHTRPSRLAVPFDAPSWALNRFSLKGFNAAYYAWHVARGSQARREPYDRIMFPLDAVRNWNRLYGPAGFYQYQCVLPPADAAAGVKALLAAIAESGQGSFLASLKTLGSKTSPGMLSFPMAGVTLALDFANHGARTLELLERLDGIVRDARGRLYPAKDGRISPAMFAAGFPQAAAFAPLVDPAFSSAFWRRVRP